MATATFNGTVIAEADDADTVRIEGNTYFPPSAVKKEFFKPTELKTQCHWKGEANYYDVEVDDEKGHNLAWYYPEPMEGSTERVGQDFTNYVAFYPQVKVT